MANNSVPKDIKQGEPTVFQASPMKLSQLIAKLTADLESNGDTEHVALCLGVTGLDGRKYRLDAHIGSDGDIEIIRDSNVTNGLACISADYQGPIEICP